MVGPLARDRHAGEGGNGMNLTPEQMDQGRRNFLRVLAGTPAVAALGVTAALRGPVPGGPVRVGFLCVGSQGRTLLSNVDPAYAQVVALCDINPTSLARADEVLKNNGQPPAKHYEDWKEMLQKENIEAVIMAPPLWMHAELAAGCLDAGKHVLCEKMMAWDDAGCARMREASHRNGKVLEIGYQRNYSPLYHSAYEGVIKTGTLGEIYAVRVAWHRNGNWRRKADPPSPDYNPAKWGYPTFDHLLNWRLYAKYSQGHMAELCSHQINAVNWFLGAAPEAVSGSGGVYRFKDGREVNDHTYAIFEYPGGQTVTCSSVESNAFDDYYEMYQGTKGTLILLREAEALLFEEEAGKRSTAISVVAGYVDTAALSSETMMGNTNTGAASAPGAATQATGPRPTRVEIQRFCSAIRVGTPLACGPDKAIGSAVPCIKANEAMKQKTRLKV
jgi:predicted dehydrogenase